MDMGHFTSRVVPVQDRQPILEHMHTTQLGGYAQTMHLQTQLAAATESGRLPLRSTTTVAHPKGRASNNNAATAKTQGGAAMTPGGATQAAGGEGSDPISLTLPDGSIVSVPYSSEQSYEFGGRAPLLFAQLNLVRTGKGIRERRSKRAREI